MTNDREKLIEKIKSLLALASDQNTTEHERNLALKRAQSIMLKYCISVSDASPDAPEMQIVDAILKLQPRGVLKTDNLFQTIVSRIAVNFGVYTLRKSNRPSEIIMMGFPTNLVIAEYVIESLFTQGWNDYRRDIPETDKNAGTCMNFWRGFRQGLATKFNPIESINESTVGIELYNKVKDVFKSRITGFIKSGGGSSSGGFSEGHRSAIESQIRSAIAQKSNEQKRIG